MDPVSEEDGRVEDTSSTSTLSVGLGDASTTAEEDEDSPSAQRMTLQHSVRTQSSTAASSSSEEDVQSSGQEDNAATVVTRIDEFQRNFEILDAALSEMSVDKAKIEIYSTWFSWIDSPGATKVHVRLFHEEIVPRTIKMILTRRYDSNRASMMNDFLTVLGLRMVTYLKGVDIRDVDPSIFEALVGITNPFSQFYLMHGHDTPLQVEMSFPKKSSTNAKFLSSRDIDLLKVGDVVHLNAEKISGKVIDQSPTETEVLVKLETGENRWYGKDHGIFLSEPWGSDSASVPDTETVEEIKDRQSREPRRFRVELEPGTYVDVKKNDLWYQGCIVAALSSGDELVVHVIGFPPSDDRMLPRFSSDLAPLNTMSSGRRGFGFVSPDFIDQDELDLCASLFEETHVRSTEVNNNFVRSRSMYVTSTFFISNAERVLEAGLINLLWTLLLFDLRTAFICLLQLSPFFTDEFAQAITHSITSRTRDCIQQLSQDQVRNLSKATVSKVIAGVYRLSRRCGSRQSSLNTADYIRLEFARKRIESETIMQRVNGLTSLCEMVEECCAARRAPWGFEKRGANATEGHYCRVRVISGISAADLALWCHEKRFLKAFFTGPGAHVELMKRSVRLIVFYSQEGILNDEDLDTLWQASQSPDSEISSTGLSILGSTCRSFSENLRRVFKNKLSELVLTNSSSLDLLKDLIWQGAPDMAKSAADILIAEALERDSEAACGALEASLALDHPGSLWWGDFRKDIIVRALTKEALRQTKSLRLMRAALESFPAKPQTLVVEGNSGSSSEEKDLGESIVRSNVIEWLLRDYGLKQILMTSLISEQVDEDAEPKTQIKLEFLAFIMKYSKAQELEMDTIESLWDTFPRGSRARETFFNWLQRLCRPAAQSSEGNDVLISENMLSILLGKLEAKPELQSMACFRLFQALFVAINQSEGKIYTSDVPLEGLRVCDDRLVGLTTMWRAALEEESSDQVADSAGAFISFFSQRLAPSIANRIWIIRSSMVDICVARLESALKGMELVVMNRCCSMLKHILKDSEQDLSRALRTSQEAAELWQRIRPHSSLGPFPALSTVTVQNTVKGSLGYNTRIQIRLRANSSFAQLRCAIADHCEVEDAADIRLFVGGTEITLRYDCRPITSCMPLTQQVLACRRQTTTDKSQSFSLNQANLSKDLPTDWLDRCSALLLESLEKVSMNMDDLGEKESEQKLKWMSDAWSLLNSLPTNYNINMISADSVYPSTEVPTVDFLSPEKSPFLLCYCLALVQDGMYGQAQEESSALYIKSRNVFDRLQNLFLALSQSEAFRSTGRRLWVARAMGMCTSMMADMLEGLHPAVLEAFSNYSQSSSIYRLGQGPRSPLVASSNIWANQGPVNLDESCSEMILAMFNKASIQHSVVSRFLPLLKVMESKKTEDSPFAELTLLDRSAALVKDLEGFCIRAYDLWTFVVNFDPEMGSWLSTSLVEGSASNAVGAHSTTTTEMIQSVRALLRSCDYVAVQGLTRLAFPNYGNSLILTLCLEELPTDNTQLLDLTANILVLGVNAHALEVDSILSILVTKLRARPVGVEGRPFPRGEPYNDLVDVKTSGLLHMIKLIGPKQRAFSESLVDCLVECVLSLDVVRCERPQSRQIAYEALDAVAVAFPEATDLVLSRRLMSCFESTDPAINRFDDDAGDLWGWDLDPCSDLRSSFGLSGLINLGCTCYINALVQQLWNIPAIRHGFHCLEVKSRSGSSTGERRPSQLSSTERKREDDLHSLRLLQSCMSHLSYSTRRAFNLEAFVRSFKDESGAVVNVLEQQDAQEFFEKTCDRFDEAIRYAQGGGTPDSQLLFKPALGVHVASALYCLDDASQQRREDAGATEWALKVELTPGGGTLQQSLEEFVSGEILTDFRWAENGPRLKTMKKTFVTELSDNLTIHIKRFQLNWETQLTEKINDRLEFPLELDMFPYTKEGVEHADRVRSGLAEASDDTRYELAGKSKKYYVYKLVGILVHSGANLNAGHYYSHIASRFGGSTDDKWFTFNDTSVTPFDVKNLADQTFGGTFKQSVVNPETKTLQEIETVVTHSAYMLFYERCNPVGSIPEQEADTSASESLVLRKNLAHLVACRWLEPSFIQLILSRCHVFSPSRSIPPPPAITISGPVESKDRTLQNESGNERKRRQHELFQNQAETISCPTRVILECAFNHFIRGKAIAGRTVTCTSIYPSLCDVIRRALDEGFASSLLTYLTAPDLVTMLFECPDVRSRLAFATLLGAILNEAPSMQSQQFVRQVFLLPAMIDLTLTRPDNSYWFALRHYVEMTDSVALYIYKLGLVPEVLNAVLGPESPSFDFMRHSTNSLAPHIKRGTGAPPASPTIASFGRNLVDNAVVTAALAVCAEIDSHPNDAEATEIGSSGDEASACCLRDTSAWISCVGSVMKQETVDRICSVIMREVMRGFDDEISVALKVAKAASVASEESIPRFYDLVAYLGIDSPHIPVAFFLGINDDSNSPGFLRRIVLNRSSLFTFGCVTLFVERLDEYPEMKTASILERWLVGVDAFLKEDSLHNSLEPMEITRMLGVLERLAQLGETSGLNITSNNPSMMDCETASTVTQQASGWQSGEDDDDDDLYGADPSPPAGEDV